MHTYNDIREEGGDDDGDDGDDDDDGDGDDVDDFDNDGGDDDSEHVSAPPSPDWASSLDQLHSD